MSARDRSIPCRHWPPSPPLSPSATCRSERIGIGDHFTSSGGGAPAGLSPACPAAGERAANSAMIAITTTRGNNGVRILTYLPDHFLFGSAGLSFVEIHCENCESRQNSSAEGIQRPWPKAIRASQLINLSPATNPSYGKSARRPVPRRQNQPTNQPQPRLNLPSSHPPLLPSAQFLPHNLSSSKSAGKSAGNSAASIPSSAPKHPK